MRHYSWSEHPEHGELAKELVLAGHSSSIVARMINQRFGSNYSRNAVIGYLTRHGANRGTTPTNAVNTNRLRAAKLRREAKPIERIRPTRAFVEQEAAGFELFGPVGDFPKDGQCKFIPGDASAKDADGKCAFQCCGFPTGDLQRHREGDPTMPWCDAHLVIVKGPSGAVYSGTSHNPELNRRFVSPDVQRAA